MLYFYGLQVGLQALWRGRFSREAFKNVVVPVNYWRALEFRLTFDRLGARRTDRILDVGSPKLLSLYLADRVGAEVYSTDIEPYFVEDYAAFRDIRRIPEERFRVMEADGRSLPFPDGHFTKAFSVSVLEHIPDEGDGACMREMARTLAPGGTCVVTVPFAPVSRNEYRPSNEFYWSEHSQGVDRRGDAFFQRRYSQADLLERLIRPSGLAVEDLRYMGERVLLPGGREVAHYLPSITGPLQPAASLLLHTRPAKSWQQLRRPLGAVITLTKR